MTPDHSLGDAVREYVWRKFGSHEAVQVVLTHESLRYLLADFTTEWINTREKPALYTGEDAEERG